MRVLPSDTHPRLIVYSDGAARGNPGPAGIGAVVLEPGGRVLDEVSEAIGIATNNVAEYRAAIRGLQAAAELSRKAVLLRADSRLLIEQLAGRFKVKSPPLQVLHTEARRILARFERVSLEHVPRAQNAHADRLANIAVDAWLAAEGGSWRPPEPDPLLFDDE